MLVVALSTFLDTCVFLFLCSGIYHDHRFLEKSEIALLTSIVGTFRAVATWNVTHFTFLAIFYQIKV